MTCYIVSFEPKSEESRKRISERLRTFKASCPIHRYCWAVESEKSAAKVRDHIAEVMESGERLFVIRSGIAAAWRNAYSEKNSAWLKEHL